MITFILVQIVANHIAQKHQLAEYSELKEIYFSDKNTIPRFLILLSLVGYWITIIPVF